MTSQRSVVFAEPVRTAIGTFGGTLKDVPAPSLGAVAIKAAVRRAGLRVDEVETVAMGNVVQAGTKMNPARQAAVLGGLPVTTPAMTVNRVCGSGAQAIVSAAQEIALGNVDVAVAGGMENTFRPNGTITAGNAPGLNDAACAMVLTDEAEKLNLRW
jgi:acetyl-CoA C-acetyltransferase